jgi:hypothetical protein
VKAQSIARAIILARRQLAFGTGVRVNANTRAFHTLAIGTTTVWVSSSAHPIPQLAFVTVEAGVAIARRLVVVQMTRSVDTPTGIGFFRTTGCGATQLHKGFGGHLITGLQQCRHCFKRVTIGTLCVVAD